MFRGSGNHFDALLSAPFRADASLVRTLMEVVQWTWIHYYFMEALFSNGIGGIGGISSTNTELVANAA